MLAYLGGMKRGRRPVGVVRVAVGRLKVVGEVAVVVVVVVVRVVEAVAG